MTKPLADKEAFYANIVGFFDQRVLASYRSEPDKYVLTTDNFRGHLRIAYSDSDDALPLADSIDIRFGYRTCVNGDLALAVYLPDLFERSSTHVQRWIAYSLDASVLIPEPDSRFDMWKARYLEGSWNIENGPRSHLTDVVELINALCLENVGQALFKYNDNPALNFPSVQNTHAYQDAHRELYGYIIDGLDMETIKRIAVYQGILLDKNAKRTVNALKNAVPSLLPTSVLWQVLGKVSNERGTAGHGVRPSAQRFSAFEEFTRDLEESVTGLKELLVVLETVFDMKGERARRRQQAKERLPRIEKTPMPHFAINKIREMVGKTVEHVEYGFRQHFEGAHESEAIILYFTDGSILGIDTGSNASHFVGKYEGLQPEDFHTDFMLYWVPAP